MIQALRISIGEITYENVSVLVATEIEDKGYRRILGPQTIVFKHNGDLHVSHSWNMTLIHISRGRMGIPRSIPFDKIILNSGQIYGPGRFHRNDVLRELNIERPLDTIIENQVVFDCPTGTFITTDYAISNIVFKPSGQDKLKSKRPRGFRPKMVSRDNITCHTRCCGVRSARSGPK